jgi:hypothetical protein
MKLVVAACLIALSALTGCVELAVTMAGSLAADRAMHVATPGESTCGGQVKCGAAADAALAQQRRDDVAHGRLVAQERALTHDALAAAAQNDCATVAAIDEVLRGFPDDGIADGFHDTVFLRYSEILRCLDEQRQARRVARVR